MVSTTTPTTYYTASGFLEQAFASAAAADAYSARSPVVNTMTLNFLMGRAIELAFKAYLLSKGISMEVLRNPRKFGHDLEAGLTLGLEKGFNTENLATPTDQEVIAVLNSHYSEKDFEYPQKSHMSGFNEGIARDDQPSAADGRNRGLGSGSLQPARSETRGPTQWNSHCTGREVLEVKGKK
jgi:hypothetical protein